MPCEPDHHQHARVATNLFGVQLLRSRESYALVFCIIGFLMPVEANSARAAGKGEISGERERILLAHYMPWYSAKPRHEDWGWHWTMNHFDPERYKEGRREIASEYYPLIGPYDSGDPAVIEYHLLLMKLAGIDGVIVDWYGLSSYRDYPMLHENTKRLVEQVERYGMNFAICYEDQTIPALVKAARLSASEQVTHAVREIEWLSDNWFKLGSYVRIENRPLLLSFGYSGLTDQQWKDCLDRLRSPVAYFSEHHPRPIATGAFDWPIPEQGLTQIDSFHDRFRRRPDAIPTAFPRFNDIYAEAEVGAGYPRVDDAQGNTFQATIHKALESNASVIQIATWNDWGEGTQIEPSQEFGYRDLELLQRMRRKYTGDQFEPQAADLRIPFQLLQFRRAGQHEMSQLDEISNAIIANDLKKARSRIELLKDARS